MKLPGANSGESPEGAEQPAPTSASQPLHRLSQHVRGQVRDLHARYEQETIMADDPLQVRSARPGVPSQELIARPQPERGRHEREHAQRPASGFQQVAEPAAGSPARIQRKVLVEQGGAQPPLRLAGGQTQADRAELRQRAREAGRRRGRVRPAGGRRAAAGVPVGRPVRGAPCAPRRCNTRPWGCASPPAHRSRDPEPPATAGPGAKPCAAKRSSPDGKRGALPALPPFYAEHRPRITCVRSLGLSIMGPA